MARNEGDVTRILADLRGAQRDEALNQLFPAVYAHLRAAARTHLRTACTRMARESRSNGTRAW